MNPSKRKCECETRLQIKQSLSSLTVRSHCKHAVRDNVTHIKRMYANYCLGKAHSVLPVSWKLLQIVTGDEIKKKKKHAVLSPLLKQEGMLQKVSLSEMGVIPSNPGKICETKIALCGCHCTPSLK